MEVIQAIWIAVAMFLGVCLVLAIPFGFVWNRAIVAAWSGAKPIDYWTAFWLVVALLLVLGRFEFGAK